MKTLSDTMNRLIGPDGVYSSNESAAKASRGVSRSTFDRIRNGHKPEASAVGVDKLDGVAKAFGLEVWQLLVPDLDIKDPPTIKKSTDAQEGITKDEADLLSIFRSLGEPERTYLLQQAQTYRSASSPKKSTTRVKGAA